MTTRDFCFWLQGWIEVENPKDVSEKQLDQIKAHLDLVFKHDIAPKSTVNPTVPSGQIDLSAIQATIC